MGWFNNSFSVDRAANGVGLVAAGAMLEYAAQQFSLPRLQHSLNMSSRDMAVGMVNGAAEGLENLNGSSGSRARGSLPDLG